MIYLDSSALLKLLVDEAESQALAAWLSERLSSTLVSSDLARLEVLRAVRRLSAEGVPALRALLSQLDLVPISRVLIDDAADIGEPALRSLDALHLATAVSLGAELTAFVAYDLRLVAAAREAGLAVHRPGAGQ